MNGARAEPCANTSSPPTSTSTTRIGRSQSFFRSRMNAQSSLINPPMSLLLKLSFHLAPRFFLISLRAPDEVAAIVRAMHKWIRACNPPHRTRWSENYKVNDAHEDGRRHPRNRMREFHPHLFDWLELSRNEQPGKDHDERNCCREDRERLTAAPEADGRNDTECSRKGQ